MEHTSFEKPVSDTLSISSLIRKAKRAAKEKDLVSALKICDSILDKFPKNKKAQKYRNDLIRSLSTAQTEPNINVNNTYQKLEALKMLLKKESYTKAEKLAIELIENFPNEALYWTTLGHIYRNLEKLGLSFQCLEKALILNHEDPEIHLEISDNFLEINDIKNGFKSLKTCLALDGKNTEAIYRLGQIYLTIKQYDQAIEEFNKILEINPEDLKALNMLGVTYKRELKDSVKAIQYFERAYQLDKTNFITCQNLSGSLLDFARLDEALKLYESSKFLEQKHLDDYTTIKFQFNHSLLLMASGKTDEAWPLWWKRANVYDLFNINTYELPYPRLDDPNKIYGKRLLVLREQGVGDQIYMLGSLKKFVEDYNCEITLDVDPRLHTLMSNSFNEFEVVSLSRDKMQNPKADFWIGYGDLFVLQNLTKKHGFSSPYLQANMGLIDHWDGILPKGKPRIGIAWRSGNLLGSRALHYTDLLDWVPLINSNHFHLINLQYSDISHDLETLELRTRSQLYLPEVDLKNDFEQISAIIKNCDLVIGPSTAVTHQSSALGVDTITYASKAYRHALGSFMEQDEYIDHWYKNTRVTRIDSADRQKLVERVMDLVNTKFIN